MKLATWNVNSIRARLPRVTEWLAAQMPDVICMQETKTEDAAFPYDDLRGLGYEIAHFGQRTYNGVAILSRTKLEDVSHGFDDDGDDDPAARFIVARAGDLRVACAYVPNGQAPGTDKFAYKLAWYARLRRWLGKHVDGGATFVLCGDFNVAPDDRDVHDPVLWKDKIHCHPDERAAFAQVLELGLEDLFRRHHPEPGHYSWWDYRMLGFPKNRGLRIDHLLATPAAAARCRDVVIDRNARKGQLPSDHAPVIATLD